MLSNKAKSEYESDYESDYDRCPNTLASVPDMLKEKMTNRELSNSIGKLSNWKVVDGKLSRSFKFHDFVDACAFMTKVSIVSEKMDHHPEFSNSYNRVSVNLFTHDLDGISILDIELAKKIDTLV